MSEKIKVTISTDDDGNFGVSLEPPRPGDDAVVEVSRFTLEYWQHGLRQFDKIQEEIRTAVEDVQTKALRAGPQPAPKPEPTFRERYPAIVAWGEELGSYKYFIDEQCAAAAADGAPANAIYKRSGAWVTVNDLAADHPFRKKVQS